MLIVARSGLDQGSVERNSVLHCSQDVHCICSHQVRHAPTSFAPGSTVLLAALASQ